MSGCIARRLQAGVHPDGIEHFVLTSMAK